MVCAGPKMGRWDTLRRLRQIGVPTTNVKELTSESTGTCTLVLDGRGELISVVVVVLSHCSSYGVCQGVAAMDIFDRLVHPLINIPQVLRQEDMSQLRVLLVDANIPRDTIVRASKACRWVLVTSVISLQSLSVGPEEWSVGWTL